MEEMIKKVDDVQFSESLTAAAIAQIMVNEGKSSQERRDIKDAEEYFGGHSLIDKKRRVFYDRDRNPIENPAASNMKMKSNFIRELVQQKQDYSLAKTFCLPKPRRRWTLRRMSTE